MINVGIIGFGRMGRFYLKEFQKNDRYNVKYICDIDASCRELAKKLSPESKVLERDDEIFGDDSVQVVVLSAFADGRKTRIEMAVKAGKHIIAEKPIGATPEEEHELVDITRDYAGVCTVNLYLRNSWYHAAMKAFIESGEIGDLAIVRVCHMTPGLAPGEGHQSEGPCFHDCGMHYVDIARWYAESEFKTWHSQGVRMWSYKDPWWVQCHGTFENGIVYDITQGFVYGQLSKDQTHNSYIDLIGTKGIVRMTHDFKTAHVELRGVHETHILDKPFGGKNIDVMISRVADAIEHGKSSVNLPTFEDATIASDYAWKFLDDAYTHDLPLIGDLSTLDEIRYRRSRMTDGYGLLPRNQVSEKAGHTTGDHEEKLQGD
jgi:predicted dehydrogenase